MAKKKTAKKSKKKAPKKTTRKRKPASVSAAIKSGVRKHAPKHARKHPGTWGVVSKIEKDYKATKREYHSLGAKLKALRSRKAA